MEVEHEVVESAVRSSGVTFVELRLFESAEPGAFKTHRLLFHKLQVDLKCEAQVAEFVGNHFSRARRGRPYDSLPPLLFLAIADEKDNVSYFYSTVGGVTYPCTRR